MSLLKEVGCLKLRFIEHYGLVLQYKSPPFCTRAIARCPYVLVFVEGRAAIDKLRHTQSNRKVSSLSRDLHK